LSACTPNNLRPWFVGTLLAPFNVQDVNANLYVTYAKQNATKNDDGDFPGFGFVDKFSSQGSCCRDWRRLLG
jgi:hypothetical protein